MAEVLIAGGQLSEVYTGDLDTLHLRAYVTQTFISAEDVVVMRSNFEQGDFWKTVTCNVIDGIVYYPAFTLPSNVDAQSDPDRSRYVLVLFRPDGIMVQAVAKRLRIPPIPNPTTLALIQQFSQNETPTPPPNPSDPGDMTDFFFTQEEILQMFEDYYTKDETDELVAVAVVALVGGAPAALNTLGELAAAINNNPNFGTFVTGALPPTGGTTGQMLVKSSNTNYAMAWMTLLAITPPGGALGDILTKSSATNYDYEWLPPAAALPPGGTTGQHLAKATDDDYDAEWVDNFLSADYSTVVHTTASIVDGDSLADLMADVGKSFIISRITVDKPCRFRLYRSEAGRDADALRPIGTAPIFEDEHRLVTEMVFPIGDLDRFVNNAPTSINADLPRTNDAAIHVTNMSGTDGTVEITMELIRLEV